MTKFAKENRFDFQKFRKLFKIEMSETFTCHDFFQRICFSNMIV